MTLTVNNKTQYLEAGIDTMLNFAKGDYANWTTRGGTKELTDINEKMIKDFNMVLLLSMALSMLKLQIVTNVGVSLSSLTLTRSSRKVIS